MLPALTCGPPHWVRMQRLLSGPWVPGSGVSGQALAVAPDGRLLFSGGHWDGSLRVTALPRGKLLNQLRRHLGMGSLGARAVQVGVGVPGWPGRGNYSVLLVPSLLSLSPPHVDVVTCLALDTCGIYLISGSRDTTCMVWRLLQQVCWVAALWGPHSSYLQPICPSVPALSPSLCHCASPGLHSLSALWL